MLGCMYRIPAGAVSAPPPDLGAAPCRGCAGHNPGLVLRLAAAWSRGPPPVRACLTQSPGWLRRRPEDESEAPVLPEEAPVVGSTPFCAHVSRIQHLPLLHGARLCLQLGCLSLLPWSIARCACRGGGAGTAVQHAGLGTAGAAMPCSLMSPSCCAHGGRLPTPEPPEGRGLTEDTVPGDGNLHRSRSIQMRAAAGREIIWGL